MQDVEHRRGRLIRPRGGDKDAARAASEPLQAGAQLGHRVPFPLIARVRGDLAQPLKPRVGQPTGRAAERGELAPAAARQGGDRVPQLQQLVSVWPKKA